MQLSFRWYGPTDSITLDKIRQIPGMKGIVTALYEIPPGEVWPYDQVAELKGRVEDAGMTITVVESVPVHEDVKMGLDTRDRYIENYVASLENIARCGIQTVCYNFMPLFDWLRTTLEYRLPDGSLTLAYFDEEVDPDAVFSGRLRLPAWNLDTDRERLERMLDFYRRLSPEQLWENLAYFLEAVVPTASRLGIQLAIHPDDPPWSVAGIPRIIVNHQSFRRLISLCDDPANGVCFCSGSLGASEDNNLPVILRDLGERGRLHFVHLRNVKRVGPRSFYESGHLTADGSVDMYELMCVLQEVGYNGPVRPDHGRMIWGETGKPGYGLYDRALGAAYLNGLWEAVSRRGA
ncbi:MAG: mannonate dehydratase [Alicyclobacillus sp.]|nr:mannonate dehydratase [Alicyclobacillus sp.]